MTTPTPVLLKLKSYTGSRSGFSQLFNSGFGYGCEWKTQNPAGGDFGYPVPPLLYTSASG